MGGDTETVGGIRDDLLVVLLCGRLRSAGGADDPQSGQVGRDSQGARVNGLARVELRSPRVDAKGEVMAHPGHRSPASCVQPQIALIRPDLMDA